MLSIQIVCVGKIKEVYLKDAISEYAKRLSKYCHIQIIEVSDEKLPTKLPASIMDEIKYKEAARILEQIRKDSYVICLDLLGKELSSEDFSKKIEDIGLRFNSCITFVIGGTLGLAENILSCANEKICFSKMTFPHQLIRVFLLEQLFRAFKISKKETYHW
ncbi:MAG: 23S rRNA (pseudouridine(1915)-N(3))-methyltransferase RlmH [Clostridia bacterium]|nr:23S rRNA (pseudouridine(1915)-N(3))-methyltransferase RlmH [Clostridia bacterium]